MRRIFLVIIFHTSKHGNCHTPQKCLICYLFLPLPYTVIKRAIVFPIETAYHLSFYILYRLFLTIFFRSTPSLSYLHFRLCHTCPRVIGCRRSCPTDRGTEDCHCFIGSSGEGEPHLWARLRFNGWRCVRACVFGLSIYSRRKDCVVYLRAQL